MFRFHYILYSNFLFKASNAGFSICEIVIKLFLLNVINFFKKTKSIDKH